MTTEKTTCDCCSHCEELGKSLTDSQAQNAALREALKLAEEASSLAEYGGAQFVNALLSALPAIRAAIAQAEGEKS